MYSYIHTAYSIYCTWKYQVPKTNERTRGRLKCRWLGARGVLGEGGNVVGRAAVQLGRIFSRAMAVRDAAGAGLSHIWAFFASYHNILSIFFFFPSSIPCYTNFKVKIYTILFVSEMKYD